jgi:hypothetical protein
VLKKAGIVVAAAAAGLFAVSPLAFAGTSHKDWGHGTDVSSFEQNSEGLVNVSDTNVTAPVQLCNNDIPVNVGLIPIQGNLKDITAAVTGALGILGKADADTDIDTNSSRVCANGDFSGDGGR